MEVMCLQISNPIPSPFPRLGFQICPQPPPPSQPTHKFPPNKIVDAHLYNNITVYKDTIWNMDKFLKSGHCCGSQLHNSTTEMWTPHQSGHFNLLTIERFHYTVYNTPSSAYLLWSAVCSNPPTKILSLSKTTKKIIPLFVHMHICVSGHGTAQCMMCSWMVYTYTHVQAQRQLKP